MENDFNYHVDLISLAIENDEHVNEPVAQARDKARNLFESGAKIDKIDVLAFPELFDLRIRANRRVIDVEHFYPTKMEMDEALELCAESIIDDCIAYADVTEPGFYN